MFEEYIYLPRVRRWKIIRLLLPRFLEKNFELLIAQLPVPIQVQLITGHTVQDCTIKVIQYSTGHSSQNNLAVSQWTLVLVSLWTPLLASQWTPEPNFLKRTLTPKGQMYCQSHMTGNHMREVIWEKSYERSHMKSYRKHEEAPCVPMW